MPQTEERNLELVPRIVETRERRSNHAVQFELDDIITRFNTNLQSIKAQFALAKQLKANGDTQYKDIYRSQIVFLESAFDFFMHEITKYGMSHIFEGTWTATQKYNHFSLHLGDVSAVLRNPEQENWFLDIVNDTYAEDTFMSSDAVIGQLNLVGIKWQKVADRAYYEQGATTSPRNKFKKVLNELFIRRNKIAHQADREHTTGEKLDIERSQVELFLTDVEKIVNAIRDEIEEMNNA